MRSKPLLLGLALLAGACSPRVASTGGAASSPAAAPAASPTSTAVPIRVVTRGGEGQYVTIVESIRGRKVYTIRALSTQATSYGTNAATGSLEQPHITFIDKRGATTVADAPKAQVNARDKTVIMTGGVHARTSSGTVLTCDTLTYHGDNERFAGLGHVQLESPNGSDSVRIAGDRLDGDVRLQDVKITRGTP